MKNQYFLILMIFQGLTVPAYAQDFITKWDLSQSGSNLNSITFGVGTSGVVSYSWESIPVGYTGSGTFIGTSVTIDSLPLGTSIRLKINPTNFNRIFMNYGVDHNRLIDVEQWGAVNWLSMEGAFSGCQFLDITALDIPNLSLVTSMNMMFHGCFSLTGPNNINSWNTETITKMFGTFSCAFLFNQNIGNWNTSSVTDMALMFCNTFTFNQNIDNWNTASVTDMHSMFSNAQVFNQNIGNWNTASVTDMSSMFSNTNSFNQYIGNWNTASVIDMSEMFSGTNSFNQNIGNWNTASVIDMSKMFSYAFTFNQDIGNWNTGSVINMNSMFLQADQFNQNIGNWNTTAVTDMNSMFWQADQFNQNIGNWNTGSVTDMNSMFSGTTQFNQSLAAWVLNTNVNLIDMLSNCNIDCNNYSNTLTGWATNPSTPNGRVFGAYGCSYSSNVLADRNTLLSSKGWTINGDILNSSPCWPTTILNYSFENNELIHIYPNPSNKYTNLIIFSYEEQGARIKLYNTVGVQVYERKVVFDYGKNIYTIITQNLTSGIYFINLQIGNHFFTRRLTIE